MRAAQQLCSGSIHLTCHLAVVGNLQPIGECCSSCFSTPEKSIMASRPAHDCLRFRKMTGFSLSKQKWPPICGSPPKSPVCFTATYRRKPFMCIASMKASLKSMALSDLWGGRVHGRRKNQDELLREFQLTCSIGIGPEYVL